MVMNVSNIKHRATREEEWRCLAPPVIFIVDGADAVVTFVMRSKSPLEHICATAGTTDNQRNQPTWPPIDG